MEKDPLYTSVCSAVTLQSHKQGFFQDYANHVSNLAGSDWLEAFGKLKNDKDRLLICYTDKRVSTQYNKFQIMNNHLQLLYSALTHTLTLTKVAKFNFFVVDVLFFCKYIELVYNCDMFIWCYLFSLLLFGGIFIFMLQQ